jgi:hypothetical protein
MHMQERQTDQYSFITRSLISSVFKYLPLNCSFQIGDAPILYKHMVISVLNEKNNLPS